MQVEDRSACVHHQLGRRDDLCAALTPYQKQPDRKREKLFIDMHFSKQLYICVEHQLQMVHWLLIRWMCSVQFPHSPFKCLFWQVYVLWVCMEVCANGGLLYGSNKCTHTAKAALRQASKISKEKPSGTHRSSLNKKIKNVWIQMEKRLHYTE